MPLVLSTRSSKCDICLERYTDPRYPPSNPTGTSLRAVVVPCGHSLCHKCAWNVNNRCPFCRKRFKVEDKVEVYVEFEDLLGSSSPSLKSTASELRREGSRGRANTIREFASIALFFFMTLIQPGHVRSLPRVTWDVQLCSPTSAAPATFRSTCISSRPTHRQSLFIKFEHACSGALEPISRCSLGLRLGIRFSASISYPYPRACGSR
jgi:hypothetical protein